MQDLHYTDNGAGFPIVLLHGFCETLNVWSGISEGLSEEYRVLMPDLPGFGKSPLNHTSFTLENIADDLSRWLGGLDVDRAIVIGHSLGGYIALALARLHPGQLAGFGLFNSSAYPDSPEKRANRDKLMDFIRREGVRPFVKTFIPSLFYGPRAGEFSETIEQLGEEAAMTPPESVIGYAAAMKDRPDRSELLRENSDKVLLIAGEYDQNVPLERTKAMASMLTPGHVHVMPDTAHMAMFEQRAGSIAAIKRFADDIYGRG